MTAFRLDFPLFPELLTDVQRLDDFIRLRFSHHQPADHQQWFQAGLVRLDNEIAGPDQPLKAGQTVSVLLPGHVEAPVNTNWYPVWENEEILAVYKPPLLPVSRTTRNLYNTLIQRVRRQTPWHEAHLLHRLDTETDGLILLAKNSAADRKWKPQLDRLIVRKIYEAQVYGVPDWQETTLEVELSEQQGSAIRCQMYVVDDHNRSDCLKPKPSCTRFRRLSSNGRMSRVSCELFTGRKHQLRAHLAHLGHPVVGDKIYAHGGRYYLKRLEQPLDASDIEALGAEHHQLTAVQLDLCLEAGTTLSIVLPQLATDSTMPAKR